MATPNTEEYLEAIYRLCCEKEGCSGVRIKDDPEALSLYNPCDCRVARPSDIAALVGVSRPSVSTALRRMERAGLVDRVHTGVGLTEKGHQMAQIVLRRHRIAERFLTDIMHYDVATVHEEACVLEHALSARLTDGLDDLLGRPETCPHGGRIPRD